MTARNWPPKWVRRLPRQRWHRVRHLYGNGEATEASTWCGRVLPFGMAAAFRRTVPRYRLQRCQVCDSKPNEAGRNG